MLTALVIYMIAHLVSDFTGSFLKMSEEGTQLSGGLSNTRPNSECILKDSSTCISDIS